MKSKEDLLHDKTSSASSSNSLRDRPDGIQASEHQRQLRAQGDGQLHKLFDDIDLNHSGKIEPGELEVSLPLNDLRPADSRIPIFDLPFSRPLHSSLHME